MKSTQNLYKFRCFSKNSSVWVDFTWNLPDFTWKSAGFHLKAARFHEICRISYGFHEIQQISCEIHPEPYKFRCFSKNSSVWVDFTWNPLDFMKSAGFHTDFIRISCEIERPLARNCNPMFEDFSQKTSKWTWQEMDKRGFSKSSQWSHYLWKFFLHLWSRDASSQSRRYGLTEIILKTFIIWYISMELVHNC